MKYLLIIFCDGMGESKDGGGYHESANGRRVRGGSS
jgi:hypothetical protein